MLKVSYPFQPYSTLFFSLWLNAHLQIQCIYQFPPVKTCTKFEISGVMWHVTPESEIQLVSCELSPKSRLGILYVWRHTGHRSVYFLSLVFLYYCPIVYPLFSILPTSFWVVRVLGNSIFRVFQFRKICDSVILRSTSEARIWLSIVEFRMFVFGVAGIEIWTKFIITLYFYLLPETIFSSAWFYTITALLVRNICSLCSSFQIFHIQVIIF